MVSDNDIASGPYNIGFDFPFYDNLIIISL